MEATTEATRWFLALFFPAVAAFYTFRILAIGRRRGASPVYSGAPGSAHFLTHLCFRVFRVTITLVCLARLVWPALDAYLVPIGPLWRPEVMLFGNFLLLAGFGAALCLHFYMAECWMSGVEETRRSALVTEGPFKITRNPMMLAVQCAQLGFFLALPTLFTLLCLAVGVAAVQVQVRLEEAVLEAHHGKAYRAYRRRTPRWLLG